MSGRRCRDWLTAFNDYASNTEAPRLMHTWAGVSAIAGCLRRRVWLDMKAFTWYPNFYIIFVAPPGIVSKSTTADLSMELLKCVPGIKFGPDIVTWPALVEAFEHAGESFPYLDTYIPQSPVTLIASELGNLINPQDREQINLYITLWDGRKGLEKITKLSGNNKIEAPWINMLGCTTPHWLADNMPPATVGGGFTSRCIFVYADKKERLIAYPDEQTATGYESLRSDLVHDLEYIAANLCGPFILTPGARQWGRVWYEKHWDEAQAKVRDGGLDEGYIARKQTHLHKLAMVLSASERDDLTITEEDLAAAEALLSVTEADLPKVFSRIGLSEESQVLERFCRLVHFHGQIEYWKAYRSIQASFPNFREFEDLLKGLVTSRRIGIATGTGGETMLVWEEG